MMYPIYGSYRHIYYTKIRYIFFIYVFIYVFVDLFLIFLYTCMPLSPIRNFECEISTCIPEIDFS